MNETACAGEVAKLMVGIAGLLAGLFQMIRTPLTAVLIILGAMSLMLVSAARLCGAEIGADPRGGTENRQNSVKEGANRKWQQFDSKERTWARA